MQIEALVFDINQFFCESKFVKDLFQLHNHGNTTCIMGIKQPNIDVFWLLIGGKKFHNHHKNIVGPF